MLIPSTFDIIKRSLQGKLPNLMARQSEYYRTPFTKRVFAVEESVVAVIVREMHACVT